MIIINDEYSNKMSLNEIHIEKKDVSFKVYVVLLKQYNITLFIDL